MAKKVIVITGAAGFIGSSLVVELSGDHYVIALDQRKPSPALINSAPGANWEEINISNATNVNSVFLKVKEDLGKIDFVIHLAAYYHFGNDWRAEYENTNIRGTENIIYAAVRAGVQRIIFSSSIAALEPPQQGQLLNEGSPSSDYIPYARSKSIGEKLLQKAAGEIPCIVLRLGGVFSDWCELPPLYSLIRLWSSPGPFSNMIPGKGKSGIPYIYLSDVVQVIKRCMALHSRLEEFEIFMISQNGAVLHKDIFLSVQRSLSPSGSVKPVYIPSGLINIGLNIKFLTGSLVNKESYEQPWMSKYIDRPWTVDNTYTQKKLGWNCSPDLGILERLPVILELYKRQKKVWINRNIQRNSGRYSYFN